MATTDAKPGFRLPWSADRNESEAYGETNGDAPIAEAVAADQEIETPEMTDAAPDTTNDLVTVDDPSAVSETTDLGAPAYEPSADAPVEPASTDDASTPAASESPVRGRKPNKFMADLTRAMQGAAETAKADTLARFAAEAKAHIETIHASTAVEATELRKQADDDVASIREWSKAEIARIREETDERITHRKSRLEREIDAHAADIEGRIERVQRRVDAFEAEMADFFQRLIAEEDATRFAAMAESLPEPPPFDEDVPAATAATETQTDDAPVGLVEDLPAERTVVVEPWPEATVASVEAPVVDESTPVETSAEAATTTHDQPVDDAAVAAEAAGESAAAETTDPDAEAAADAFDPRLDALGLTPDFAAAEAEAAAFTPEDGPAEEIPMIADDALAARLAGLVPDADSGASESLATRVIVTGLVSVASIAGFKRQLSRVAGVQSVGVSSGPDGEFFFAVAHDAGIPLKDAITTLPGFGARVTAETEDELTVTARDPETEG